MSEQENLNQDSNKIVLPQKITYDNDIVLELLEEPNPDQTIHNSKMEIVPIDDPLNQFLGKIPEISAAVALGSSFRIVMPAGVFGKLMHLVNDPTMSGLMTTSILGSNGQIIGVAGLSSLAGFGIPLLVWSILAFITGQFYLRAIERNTRAIFDILRDILFFLVAKETSEFAARIEFLQNVSENLAIFSRNSDIRISSLTNLQRTNSDSLSGINLWKYIVKNQLKEINAKVEDIERTNNNNERSSKVKKLFEIITETRENINRLIGNWQCFCIGSSLEIQLGSLFEVNYLNYKEKVINRIYDETEELISESKIVFEICRQKSVVMDDPNAKTEEIASVTIDLKRFDEVSRMSHSSAVNYLEYLRLFQQNVRQTGFRFVFYNNRFYSDIGRVLN